jgi:hypothetical protein
MQCAAHGGVVGGLVGKSQRRRRLALSGYFAIPGAKTSTVNRKNGEN